VNQTAELSEEDSDDDIVGEEVSMVDSPAERMKNVFSGR
jgi:hypothetical protein